MKGKITYKHDYIIWEIGQQKGEIPVKHYENLDTGLSDIISYMLILEPKIKSFEIKGLECLKTN